MTRKCLFSKNSVILRYFRVKLHPKCPFSNIPDAALSWDSRLHSELAVWWITFRGSWLLSHIALESCSLFCKIMWQTKSVSPLQQCLCPESLTGWWLTYLEWFLSIKIHGLMRSSEKLKTNFHHHNAYGNQSWLVTYLQLLWVASS